jgi:hypothetical protein
MKTSVVLLLICLTVGVDALIAQIPGIPKFPGMGRRNKDDARRQRQQQDEGSQVTAAGVPAPADSPLYDAFRKLEQQPVYDQRITLTVYDPQMSQIMSQMGFTPAETITAGDMKQVSIHVKMPVSGQVEDFELRAVLLNGRLAKKWSSPASGRILKEQDASIAKQLAQAEMQSAKSIARNLASGTSGVVSAGVAAAGAAASVVAARQVQKQAHDFFEWTCMDGGGQASQARSEPPPITDVRVIGDQTLDGIAVTSYEFYVHQNGRFQGPVQLHVAKETGLPMRIGMNDPQARGGMQMDYFGFNQRGDIEVPACLGQP